MSKYVVLIADGVTPDGHGDIVDMSGVSWAGEVPLRWGVDGPIIGAALLEPNGNRVVAQLSIDTCLVHPKFISMSGYVPAIAGMAMRDDDGNLTSLEIQAISLCESNADSRVPPIPGPPVAQRDQGREDD